VFKVLLYYNTAAAVCDMSGHAKLQIHDMSKNVENPILKNITQAFVENQERTRRNASLPPEKMSI
jgi:hypothetical protein